MNIMSHDPVEQPHKVMKNIRQLIEEAVGSMGHLVKVVVYIADVRHREDVYRTMGEYIKGCTQSRRGWWCKRLRGPNVWLKLILRQ